jgi:hypothetical protein
MDIMHNKGYGFALLLALYAFYRFTKYRKQLILTEENKIRNSPDYQRQCIEIDCRYENAKIVYENESVKTIEEE